jgi:hypothetical protein
VEQQDLVDAATSARVPHAFAANSRVT